VESNADFSARQRQELSKRGWMVRFSSSDLHNSFSLVIVRGYTPEGSIRSENKRILVSQADGTYHFADQPAEMIFSLPDLLLESLPNIVEPQYRNAQGKVDVEWARTFWIDVASGKRKARTKLEPDEKEGGGLYRVDSSREETKLSREDSDNGSRTVSMETLEVLHLRINNMTSNLLALGQLMGVDLPPYQPSTKPPADSQDRIPEESDHKEELKL
jgi:hypothetical protein